MCLRNGIPEPISKNGAFAQSIAAAFYLYVAGVSMLRRRRLPGLSILYLSFNTARCRDVSIVSRSDGKINIPVAGEGKPMPCRHASKYPCRLLRSRFRPENQNRHQVINPNPRVLRPSHHQ